MNFAFNSPKYPTAKFKKRALPYMVFKHYDISRVNVILLPGIDTCLVH